MGGLSRCPTVEELINITWRTYMANEGVSMSAESSIKISFLNEFTLPLKHQDSSAYTEPFSALPQHKVLANHKKALCGQRSLGN